MKSKTLFTGLFAPVLLGLTLVATAQPGGFGAGGGGGSAQTLAPIDITGNWVSLITEDWRFRMFEASPGDYEGISLTGAGRELANSWDPEADNGCKAFGVGGLTRQPTRIQIDWENDNVLRLDFDAGNQTRLLKFGAARDEVGAGSLQGVSHASWSVVRGGFGEPPAGGTLNVTTTDMSTGYVRPNGVPYSDQAMLTEYFELLKPDNGEEYLVVISILSDPVYLSGPVITSTNFKREADNSQWSPRKCN